MDFYIFEDAISSRRKSELQKLLINTPHQIYFLSVPFDKFPQLELTHDHLSRATFGRLMMGELLPDSLERVIYLDCDVLVLSSLRPLAEIDLHGKVLGAVEDLGVEVEYLTAASADAFYRTDLTVTSVDKTDSDEDVDSATTGAILTKKIDDEKVSKLVVFSNAVFATDTRIQVANSYYIYAIDLYNNKDILLNSISYLTEREDNITIRKNVEITTYTVTEQQHRVILTIIFAVPIAVIILGIVVWQIRRRKK